MPRLDRVHQDQETRILAALRAGEMSTTELGARLRTSHIIHALHRLEAQGLVVCVRPAQGAWNAAVWDLPRRLERSA